MGRYVVVLFLIGLGKDGTVASVMDTRKALAEFNPKAASDEMNLCEFAFGYLGKQPPKGVKTLEFEDRVWDVATHSWQPQKRTIIGSSKYGLPGSFDEDVIIALVQLCKLQSNFQDPQVHFTRYQIAELLRLPDKGSTYNRIK